MSVDDLLLLQLRWSLFYLGDYEDNLTLDTGETVFEQEQFYEWATKRARETARLVYDAHLRTQFKLDPLLR